MKDSYHYEKLNPIDLIARRYGIVCDHIDFDPGVERQYRIIRQSSHDSTFLFTYELVVRALHPIINSYSYFKPNPPQEGDRLRYTVGWLRLLTVYGTVELPVGRFHGCKQRVILPVRCEIIRREKAA